MRVSQHDNAAFYLGCAINSADTEEDHIVLATSIGNRHYDFIICATGFSNDFNGRDEFAEIAPFIRTWGDGRYQPSMGQPRIAMIDAPDLGDGFEFREKIPMSCPQLSRIHCFNDAAMLTHGKLSGDIPAVSAGADRLVRHITSVLFAADVDEHFERLQAYDIPELSGDEWVDATVLLQAGKKVAVS